MLMNTNRFRSLDEDNQYRKNPLTGHLISFRMQRKKAIKPPSFLSQMRSKNRVFLLSMASILSLLVLSLFLAFSLCSATHRNLHRPPSSHHSKKDPNQDPASVTPEIHQACKATQFPELCESSLSKNTFPNPPKPVDIIFAAMEISAQNVKTAQSMVQTILDHANGNPNTTNAAKNCIEFLGYSQYRLSLSSAPEILPRGKIKDARAWMSASALYQYDCWSALKYVNTTQLVNETMAFVNSLSELTSNALSMIVSYDLFGNDTVSWRPPRTERDGFWGDDNGGGRGSGFKGGFPSGLTPDVTVCKTEAGCYRTVQRAVDAAPELLSGGRRFVIHIKEGVYEEIVRVPLAKRNLVFLGDGMGKTVITGNLNVQLPGVSTFNTATVGVVGDGFLASGLTIENTAGPDVHQAVAYRSDSDFSIVENCEFKGHQDTLYAHSLRQFYNRCRIMGTIDFIFGNSATIFQDCTIQVQPRQLKPEKGETNAVTAQGRTDPAQSTGFVFQHCLINGTDDYMSLYYQNPKVHKTYLGRPWKQYSRTVFIQCYLEALIRPEGWLPWDGDLALSTLFYGEFDNSGPGASTSGRVRWSNQIPAEHVLVYSLENFIQADEWLPLAPPQ